MSDTLPPPFLGADPLRPPPAADTLAGDPILDGYGPRDATPDGEAAGLPVGPAEVTAGLVAVFDALAALRGPHWAAEPDEFAMAAPPLARYLNQPDTTIAAWLASHGDQLLIVAGLGFVIVPRAAIEWRVMRARRQALELEQTAALYEEPTDGAYPYRAFTPQPGAAGGPYPGGAVDGAPPGDAGGGVRDSGEGGGPAMGYPSDPRAVAAAIGAIIG